MSDAIEPQDSQPASELPAQPAPPINSRFLYVDVAALRAKQLRKGAQPRIADTERTHLPRKAERIAMEEVRQGLVYYDIPEPKRNGAEAAE